MSQRIKEALFILGIGAVSGFYGLTCFTFILAFITGYDSVTIHMNIWGELTLEFIITILSIPCAIYAVKEAIRLKKVEFKKVPE